MSSQPQLRVAVLDDYAAISSEHFVNVCQSNGLDLKVFTEPLKFSTFSDLANLASELKDFTVISTMRERTPFRRDLLTQLPNLKLILTTGNRNAGIDIPTCQELGIVVAGTGPRPGMIFTHSDTNEQNWALILGLAKNIAGDDHRLKHQPDGRWQDGLVFGLAGKTLGLLGLGRLGLQCAVTGILGFGMTAIAWSANLTQAKADEAAQSRGLPVGSIKVMNSKEDLLRTADVLSVHYVLSDRSRGMLGANELALMKKTALLVNTSRGPIIDEVALLETLRDGRIRGAALDVFDQEPLPADSPWRSQEWGKNGRAHVLLSPHTGYIEETTMHDWYQQNAENLQRWLDGQELLHILK